MSQPSELPASVRRAHTSRRLRRAALDVDHMTPMEALALLAKLKKN
jgi:hypothetical protein